MLEKASSETEQITISEFDEFHSIFNSVLTKVLRLFPLRSKELITPLARSPFPAGEGLLASANICN